MFMFPVLITAVLAATPPKPALSDAQRRELAAIVATLNAVESRLQREMALGDPQFAADVSRAVDLTDPSGMGSSCPAGTCRGVTGCVTCLPPPLATLLRADYNFAVMKTRVMTGTTAPNYAADQKKILAITRDLVKIFKS